MKYNLFISFMLMFLYSVGTNSIKVSTKDKGHKQKTFQQYNLETKRFLKDWSLVLHTGVTMPYTDIRSYDWFRQVKKPSEVQWGAGIGLTKMFGSAFGINLDYTLGRISGRTIEEGGFAEDRKYWKQLGFNEPVYFNTSVFHQTSINFYINWLGLSFGYNKFIKSQITKKPIKPRIFALYNKIGIGFWRGESNIYNVSDNKNIDGSAYTRGFTNKFTEVVFPFTTGMKFKLSKTFDLGVEGTFVFMNSDKLDAFNFSNSNNIFTGQTVNSLSKINRDAYLYVNVNLTYKFGRIGSQKEHVEWINPLEMIALYHQENKAPLPPPLLDSDGDGVLDIVDEEPDTEEGAKVDTKGRTDNNYPEQKNSPLTSKIEDYTNRIDSILKVIEKLTECKAIENCLTEKPKTEQQEKTKEEPWQINSIYFDYNKSTINPLATTELKKIALLMKKKPNLIVEVQGNTDLRGSTEYNKKLSEDRVNAAIRYLVRNFGIPQNRFKKLPLGMNNPSVKNASTESEHQINRRVDFILIGLEAENKEEQK